MDRRLLAAGVAAVALSAGALALVGTPVRTVADPVAGSHPTKMCEDWGFLTDGECFAAGGIRFGALQNLSASGQFCKWQAANPGEWGRIQAYAVTATPPANIVTWYGGGIRDLVTSYLAAGGPTFTLVAYSPPNRCKTPLKPPTVTGVTPGETTVTVTVAPPG